MPHQQRNWRTIMSKLEFLQMDYDNAIRLYAGFGIFPWWCGEFMIVKTRAYPKWSDLKK